MDGQKPQLDIKTCGGMMTLVTVLVRSENYGGSGSRETSKANYLKAKKKARRTAY